jgi:hypothetical protein
MHSLIQLKRATPAILVVFACYVLAPTTQALLPSPPPDGGYPNNNTAEGDGALFNVTNGSFDTAIGSGALFHNTTGSWNTAIGFNALIRNTEGSLNTAVGEEALTNNTTGSLDTAIGSSALVSNTTGLANTATGFGALAGNTTGDGNTAVGFGTLDGNTHGSLNTATGTYALTGNTTGVSNTAVGGNALFQNMTGDFNTANGVSALFSNTTGLNNTANGKEALFSNTTGRGNTADGLRTLFNNTTGSHNVALGVGAGSNLNTGDDNIFIANQGFAADSNKIRIGTGDVHRATFIAGIRNVTVPSGIPVVVAPNGQLGTMTSSARFKQSIKPMDKASEAILSLKPVTFHYKSDNTCTSQFGLIAEEVAAVNPDLIVRDENGDIYTVRYDQVNAMLLNEFLKEHYKNEAQEKTIAELKSGMIALAATVKQQASQIQKVSAELEGSKPAPQVVNNP